MMQQHERMRMQSLVIPYKGKHVPHACVRSQNHVHYESTQLPCLQPPNDSPTYMSTNIRPHTLNTQDEKLSEFENFKAAFTAKDMEEMKAIGWRNRGFLLGIVLPTVAFLRFPALIGTTLSELDIQIFKFSNSLRLLS